MRVISEMATAVLHSANSARDYTERCSHLVRQGFTPYGKPYKHGDYLIREFVKYSYTPVDEPRFEWEEEADEGTMVPEDPWETHDYFESINGFEEEI
jgi:hypothetical protein